MGIIGRIVGRLLGTEPEPQVGGEPLPPSIPPQALSMLRPPPEPAPTRVVAGPPRGSLRDRIAKCREQP